MSQDTEHSGDAARCSSPENEFAWDSRPSLHTAGPESDSEDGSLPLVTGLPADSPAGTGDSAATHGQPLADTQRGRRGHRRHEQTLSPPPPPPEFSDSSEPAQPRMPVPTTADVRTTSQMSTTWSVPSVSTTQDLRTPPTSSPSGAPDKNGQHLIRTGLEGGLDCAICLQACVHPVRLPCQHVFCFLCAKGAIKNSRRCAMCRSEVPADYLDNPLLLNTEQLRREMAASEGYQWYYEGRNGWWKYDERTAAELEAAFAAGEPRAELLVAGYRYLVDFESMVQLRRSDPARRRRVKRDLASAAKKGVAGLRASGGGAETALEPALQGLTLTEEGDASAL